MLVNLSSYARMKRASSSSGISEADQPITESRVEDVENQQIPVTVGSISPSLTNRGN